MAFKFYQTKYPTPARGRIVVSSQYTGVHQKNVGAFVPTSLRAYYMPLAIPYPLIISELSVDINIADGTGNAMLAIFASERGTIGKLIDYKTLNISAAVVSASAFNVSLSTGIYFLCFFAELTVLSVYKCTVTGSLLGYAVNTGTSEYSHYYNDIASYATGLSDSPNVTLATGDCPHIYAKVKV